MSLENTKSESVELVSPSTTLTCNSFPITDEKPHHYIDDVEKNANVNEVLECIDVSRGSWIKSLFRWCWRSPNIALPPPIEHTFVPRVRSLEDCPDGYPRLAAFLSSDPNFMLYRGFGYLRSRVLLTHQYELVELEKELDKLDKVDHKHEHTRKRLASLATDKFDAELALEENIEGEEPERTRTQIVAEIEEKLSKYDELILKCREVVSLQRPSDRDYRSVCRWMCNVKPLITSEMDYVNAKEDFVTLRTGRECAGFDGFVEKLLQKMNGRIVRRLFLTRELREKTSDKDIHYYSPSRVDTLVGLLITAVIFVLLILPVIAMYLLTNISSYNSTFRALGVLIVFTLLFGAAMSILTRARRHELFAASAAYCAVLVVFISNFGGSLS